MYIESFNYGHPAIDPGYYGIFINFFFLLKYLAIKYLEQYNFNVIEPYS